MLNILAWSHGSFFLSGAHTMLTMVAWLFVTLPATVQERRLITLCTYALKHRFLFSRIETVVQRQRITVSAFYLSHFYFRSFFFFQTLIINKEINWYINYCFHSREWIWKKVCIRSSMGNWRAKHLWMFWFFHCDFTNKFCTEFCAFLSVFCTHFLYTV